MPAAIVEDRSLAKALYLEGLSLKEVAQNLGVKLGTVCSWKHRDKWDELPRKKPEEKALAVQSVAEEFGNYATKLSRKILCKLDSLNLKDLRDCREASTALATAYQTARKALGLDDNQGQVHLHVHAMGRVALEQAQPEQAPVIDVTPQPVVGPDSQEEPSKPDASAPSTCEGSDAS